MTSSTSKTHLKFSIRDHHFEKEESESTSSHKSNGVQIHKSIQSELSVFKHQSPNPSDPSIKEKSNPDLLRLKRTEKKAINNIQKTEKLLQETIAIYEDLKNPKISIEAIRSRLQRYSEFLPLNQYIKEALKLKTNDFNLLLYNPFLILKIENHEGLNPIEQLINQLQFKIKEQQVILELAALEFFVIDSMTNPKTFTLANAHKVSNQAREMFENLTPLARNILCNKIWKAIGSPQLIDSSNSQTAPSIDLITDFVRTEILKKGSPGIFHELENSKITEEIIKEIEHNASSALLIEHPFTIHLETILESDNPSIRFSILQLYQFHSFLNLLHNPQISHENPLIIDRFKQLHPSWQKTLQFIIQIQTSQNPSKQDAGPLDFSLFLTIRDLSGNLLIDHLTKKMIESIDAQRKWGAFQSLHQALTDHPSKSKEKVIEEFSKLNKEDQDWLKLHLKQMYRNDFSVDSDEFSIENNPYLLLPVLNEEIKKMKFSIETVLIRPWLNVQKIWTQRDPSIELSVTDPIETLRFSATAVKTALTAPGYLQRNPVTVNLDEVFYSKCNINLIRNDLRAQNLSQKVASLLPQFADSQLAPTLAQHNITSVQWGLFQDTSLPEWNFRVLQSHIGTDETKEEYQSYSDLLQAIIQKENLQIALPQACIIPTQMGLESDLAFFLVLDKKTESADFSTEFYKLNLDQQQRCARDLCRFIALTGYQIPSINDMSIVDGKIKLHHLPLHSINTMQQAQEYAIQSLKRLLEDPQFCGHWNGERFPVLRIAAEKQLTMLNEKKLDSLEARKDYRYFFKIMKDPASSKEQKQTAFQRLPEEMRHFLHFCVYSGLKELVKDGVLGKKRVEADIDILTQLTNQSGMDILEQIELRYSLTEILNILRWTKEYLTQENIKPELLCLFTDTLQKTLLGSSLLAPIAYDLIKKIGSIQEQHEDLSDQELFEQVRKALIGDRDQDGILDIYIHVIDAAKQEVTIPAIQQRVYLNREFDPNHFPVKPTDKQQIQVGASLASLEQLPQRMRLLTIAYECAQYGVKFGGLGEAIYGTAKALKDKGCAVTILMPKFSTLAQPRADKIDLEGQETTIAHLINGQRKEVKVKTIEEDGMTLAYMEDPDLERNHFAIESGVYADGNLATERPWHGLKERMAYYGSATAEYVVAHQDEFDAILFNDWHAAYAIDRIAHRNFSDWVCGKFPANVLAIHNGSYGCQGVYEINDSDILHQFDDQRPGLNIMQQAVQLAERSVAVSESYAQELQYGPLSAGIGPWMRKAASEGRLKGIVNGSNPDLWDPHTNTTLKNWKDPATDEAIDLSYSPETSDLVAHKKQVRSQLFKALQRYYPEALAAMNYKSAEDMIDNPLLLYVGRYDQAQKGIDKLVQIMEAAHQRGGRLITMGTGEMNGAPEILDRLSQRADELKCGWITRGIDDASLKMQKGDPQRGIPALGPLIRAAADFYCAPSSFEPCGLVQTEGWLYGALAIGTSTGGLADTIINDQSHPRFNGFTFDRLYNWESEEQNNLIRNTTLQALDYWTSLDTATQNQMIARVMRDGKQLSWTTSPNGISASERYLLLIKEAIDAKKARATQTTDLLGIEDAQAPQRDNYFGQGVHTDLYLTFGAHVHNGGGVNFRVMAPAAQEVRLVTIQRDGWENPSGKETLHEMHQLADGSWQAHLLDAGVGTLYQYEILNAQGQLVRKADPFGFGFEKKDFKISNVTDPIDSFAWTDQEWIQERPMRKENAPVNIYEIHIPSWFKPNDEFISYPEIARRLVAHCHEMGFNYVEIFGIFEHLLDESMGYQVIGFFAPTSRNGTLQQFQEFVNVLHENGIGVIADFVPSHFVKDDGFLSNFDGTHFFENHDRYNRNSTWGTHTFNFDREDVRNFLLSSARFFIDECHLDGLRVDAVAHFLAYSRWREKASWNPGPDGTEWNRAGVEFVRQLNRLAHDRNVLTISENSWTQGYTDTLPIDHPSGQGLGFDLRFNMESRSAAFEYFRFSQQERSESHRKADLRQRLTDNPHQNYIGSYISHDEIKIADHGHISDQIKHPEDNEDEIQKKVQLFYALNAFGPHHARMMVMGTEFGLKGKWDPRKGLTWDTFDQPVHQMFKHHCAQVNQFYLDNPTLWSPGVNLSQFNWIQLLSPNPVIAYERIDQDNPAHRYLVIHNFSKIRFENFMIQAKEQEAIARIKQARIAFRSDIENWQELGELKFEKRVSSQPEPGYELINIPLPEYATVVIEEFC